MITEIIPLRKIAYARSGDKGSNSNIGVIAFSAKGYEFLEKNLTAEKVACFFGPIHPKSVIRYELPNLWAFNFILEGVLNGGGTHSLRLDAQGKSFGQVLLEMPMTIPEEALCWMTREGCKN